MFIFDKRRHSTGNAQLMLFCSYVKPTRNKVHPILFLSYNRAAEYEGNQYHITLCGIEVTQRICGLCLFGVYWGYISNIRFSEYIATMNSAIICFRWWIGAYWGQANTWTNAGLMLTGASETNFSIMLIKIQHTFFQENAFKYVVCKEC